jgi:hypothetical protein
MATTMAAEAVEMTARIARKPKSNPSMITYAHDSRRIVDTVALRMMARRGEDTYCATTNAIAEEIITRRRMPGRYWTSINGS